MLLQNPQLAYALLQAQVIMRIVDPATAVVSNKNKQIKKLSITKIISIALCTFGDQLQSQYLHYPFIVLLAFARGYARVYTVKIAFVLFCIPTKVYYKFHDDCLSL